MPLLMSRLVARRPSRVGARLVQSGVAGALGSGVFSFARAGVAYDLAGASYAENLPRFDAGAGYQASQNLLLNNVDLSNASWTKTNVSVTANNTTAPDGTVTAALIANNSTNGNHQVSQSTVVSTGNPWTISVYAKMNTCRYMILTTTSGTEQASFDLQAGTVFSTGVQATSAGIVSAGSGWYRCWVTITAPAGTSFHLRLSEDGSTVSYAGSGVSLWVWGAQSGPAGGGPTTLISNAGSITRRAATVNLAGLRIEPAATNVALQSEAAGTTWTANNVTISSNNANNTAPTGTAVADKIIETAAAGVWHGIHQACLTPGAAATISVYAKAGSSNGGNWLFLSTDNGATPGDGAYFNLLTGAVGTTTGGTARMTRASGDWWRCEFTTTAAVTTAMVVAVGGSDGGVVHAGSTSVGLWVWGMQAELTSYATRYIPTTTASVTRNNETCSFPSQGVVRAASGTILVRVRPTGVLTSGLQMILDLAGTTTSGMYLALNAGKFRLAVGNGSTLNTAEGTTTAVAGTEYVVGATWGPDGFMIAVNGVIEDSSAGRAGDQVLTAQTYVGYQNVGTQRFLNGSISELQILDRKLTRSELCTLTSGQRIPHLDCATLYAPFYGNFNAFRRAKRWENG